MNKELSTQDWAIERGLFEYEMRSSVKKLEAALKPKGIVMQDIKNTQHNTNNIRFINLVTGQHHDMSNHSVYRYSGMGFRVNVATKDGDPVKITPITNDDWVLKIIQPIVLLILKGDE